MLAFVFGILTIAGALGGDTSTASGSTYYDSGYASFGADFYTYVSNNAAEAASAGRTAAKNLDEIASLAKIVCGGSLMLFGLFAFCFFGIKFEEAKATTATSIKENPKEQAIELSVENAEAPMEAEPNAFATSENVPLERPETDSDE